MPEIGILCLHLAYLGGQEMLQGPKGLLNPAPSAPCPDEGGGWEVRRPVEQVVAVAPRLVEEPERDRAVGGAGRREAGISAPWQLGAVPPAPLLPGQQVGPCDLAPIGQVED